MRIRDLFIVLLSFLFATAAVAQQSVSPQLQAAVDAWLADDDATALPALSALAAAGDSDASLILERISSMTPAGAESVYVSGLTAADRQAIFQPGGGSPLEVLAAQGDGLAKALLAADAPGASIELAHTLHAFGEVERARYLAWSMLEEGKLADVITMSAEEPLFRDLDWLWWMRGWMAGGALSAQPLSWVLVSEAKGRAPGLILANWSAQFIAATTPLTPELKRVAGALDGNPSAVLNAGPADVEFATKMIAGLARRDPAMRPLGAICAKTCGEEVGACMLEGLRLLGGYGALMPLDTPLERVISQTAYTTSPKAENLVLRLMRVTAPAAKGQTANQCLLNAING